MPDWEWFDRARFGMFIHWNHASRHGWELSWPLVGGTPILPYAHAVPVDEYYADPSLCQRLSMTGPELHQARQALITQDLVAYQRPLSQVLALDAAPSEATPRASTGAADDEPVDLKAVFARIWEVLA